MPVFKKSPLAPVGGFNPFEFLKLDHLPRDRDENQKKLKPRPSYFPIKYVNAPKV